MKRFEFRLQSVLNYRQYLEHLAEQEVARAYQAVAEAEKQLDALKQDQAVTDEALDRASAKGISAVDFHAYQDYLAAIDSEITRQKAHIKNLENDVVKKQRDLTQRSIARKIMERLKEKKRQRYVDDYLKWEQAQLDETVSVKKAREVNSETT